MARRAYSFGLTGFLIGFFCLGAAACTKPYAPATSRAGRGAFQGDADGGAAQSRLQGFAIIPGSLRWLPNDDHAYVVDSALETVIEASGLDVYQEIMQVVRQFR